MWVYPKLLGPRSDIERMLPLQVCGGTKNPIRVGEINNIVVSFTLMLVPPHTCRGATAILSCRI